MELISGKRSFLLAPRLRALLAAYWGQVDTYQLRQTSITLDETLGTWLDDGNG